MGVRTTSDRKRDEAKEKLQEAYILLLEAINPNVWGTEEWSDDYISKIHSALFELAKMNRDL